MPKISNMEGRSLSLPVFGEGGRAKRGRVGLTGTACPERRSCRHAHFPHPPPLAPPSPKTGREKKAPPWTSGQPPPRSGRNASAAGTGAPGTVKFAGYLVSAVLFNSYTIGSAV